MDALFAYIATNPVGPLISMAVIVVIVLVLKSVLKVQRNEDGYVSVPDDDEKDGEGKTDAPDKTDGEQ